MKFKATFMNNSIEKSTNLRYNLIEKSMKSNFNIIEKSIEVYYVIQKNRKNYKSSPAIRVK